MRSNHMLCSIIIAILFINCQGQPQQTFVAINLLSYTSDDTKKALLVNGDTTRFEILDPVTSELVYEGSLTTMSSGPSIRARASLNDLSDFGSKGYFKIKLENKQEIKLKKNAGSSKGITTWRYEEGAPGILIVEPVNNKECLRGKELSKFPGRSCEDNENNYFLSERSSNTAGNYDNY